MATTSNKNDDDMTYLQGIPNTVPTGRVVVHNHVRPAARLGDRGFRAWTQKPVDELVLCDCGWAPGLDSHYRVDIEAARRRMGLK